jgi:hypothetical protein
MAIFFSTIIVKFICMFLIKVSLILLDWMLDRSGASTILASLFCGTTHKAHRRQFIPISRILPDGTPRSFRGFLVASFIVVAANVQMVRA